MANGWKTIELLRQASGDVAKGIASFGDTPQERMLKAKMDAKKAQQAGLAKTAQGLAGQVQSFAQNQPDMPSAYGEMPALSPQKEQALDLINRLNSTNYDVVKGAVDDGYRFFKDSIDKQTQPTLDKIEGKMTELAAQINESKAEGKTDADLKDSYQQLKALQHAVSDTYAMRASARLQAEKKDKDPTKASMALKAFSKYQAGGQLDPGEQMLVFDMFSGLVQAGAQAGLFSQQGMKGFQAISKTVSNFSNKLNAAPEKPGLKPTNPAVQTPPSSESIENSLLNDPLFNDLSK